MVALRWRTELHTKWTNTIAYAWSFIIVAFAIRFANRVYLVYSILFIYCTTSIQYYSARWFRSVCLFVFVSTAPKSRKQFFSQWSHIISNNIVAYAYKHLRVTCIFPFAYITYCCATNAQHQQESSKWRG